MKENPQNKPMNEDEQTRERPYREEPYRERIIEKEPKKNKFGWFLAFLVAILVVIVLYFTMGNQEDATVINNEGNEQVERQDDSKSPDVNVDAPDVNVENDMPDSGDIKEGVKNGIKEGAEAVQE